MSIKNLKISNPVDPALQFLSQVQDDSAEEKSNANTEPGTRKPIPIQDRSKTDKNGRELKRKRYNLLLVPSIFEDIEKIAYVEKISANEAINRALVLYRENEKDTLEKFIEIEKLKASNRPKN
jgi:hypothetical protein